MKLKIDDEFKEICSEIVNENKTDEEWKEIESCDMFQSEHYCGGYEEEAFCFTYYRNKNEKFWFEVPLRDLSKIIIGEITEIDMRPPD